MPPHLDKPADTTSYWIDSVQLPGFGPPDRDGRFDVVVVGAGITGLTAAWLLAAAGKSVAVVERRRAAEIDTGHTTAHLTMVTDTRLTELVDRFGRDHAQAVWDAGLAAIDQIHRIVRRQNLDCGFAWVDGYLHAPIGPPGSGERDEFRREAALASELGFDAAYVDAVPFLGRPGIRFDQQARFHPRRYLAGLAAAFVAQGGRIFENSEVDEFRDDPRAVVVRGRTLSCTDIVIATHNPLVGLSGMVSATAFQTKLALYTSYVVAGRVPRGTVPDALYWDTADPYRYLRLEAGEDHDLVIFGGEDHKTGQASDTGACYARLERVLRELVPGVELTHHWSGQVIETPDGLPYIGSMADHQYAATGFAGNGMTFGTLGGMMCADAILGRKNPWTDLFDPGRPALRRGLWEYIKENADYPYYMIRDRFAGAEGRSLRDVKRGEGKVIERKGQKVAVHRNDGGETIVRSATCTHMGCTVGWNAAERTWDCPCHGSRFRPDGGVISGPAEAPLAEAE